MLLKKHCSVIHFPRNWPVIHKRYLEWRGRASSIILLANQRLSVAPSMLVKHEQGKENEKKL